MTDRPFKREDHPHLIAPPETFAGAWPAPKGGRAIAAPNALRSCLALELAHQVARRIPGIVLKGGTLLQARASWPPLRASVDVDLEWRTHGEVMAALGDFAEVFRASGVTVDAPRKERFSTVTHVRFAARPTGETAVRVDVGEPGSSTECSEPWHDAPAPWRGSAPLRVPTRATQAAQKLLLAAPAPFGRDLDDHIGRQSLCKDLFDLHVLGALDLGASEIRDAAKAEIRFKGARAGWPSPRKRAVEGALAAWQRFSPPRGGGPPDSETLWRAFLRIRASIGAPFTDGDVRIAAGCAHHAVSTLFEKSFDWSDAWTPRRTGGPRKAWVGAPQIEPVVHVSDDFLGAKGLAEAWASPKAAARAPSS